MVPFQMSISKGLLHSLGGFTFPAEYYLDPHYRQQQDLKIEEFLHQEFKTLPLKNYESNLMQSKYVQPNSLLIGAIQPNLILGKILGTDFVFPDDADSDIDHSPLKEINQLPSLESLLEHPFITLLDEQLRLLKWEKEILIPPFFWDTSGRATIHGPLTTAFKLVGQELFILFYDEPAKAHTILEWCVDAYISLIEHFNAFAPFAVSSLHIGECSGCLLSKEDFDTFTLPYIEKLAARWPVRLHSCGLSDHLLPTLCAIPNLASLDVGSETSVATIRRLMGPNFLIEVSPPVEVLLQGVEQEIALGWLDKTVAENNGGPLMLNCHVEPGYSLQNIEALYLRSRVV